MESSTCCARNVASSEDTSRIFDADIACCSKDINKNHVNCFDRCPSCDGRRDQSFRSSDRRNVCELCERLRGYDYSNIADSEERFVRRTKHKSRVSLTRRDGLQADASDDYVSSVVRWNSFRWSRGKRTAVWLILFLSIMVSPILAKEMPKNSSKNGVCQSLDIRNRVENFNELRGCRIIEGFLQIVLLDRATPSDFANISFPELREITGYLLFYRVPGLLSIGSLFPNLTVIRGQLLFMNDALVIIEMMGLQEIGLYNLVSITRGSVHIDKNPSVCYVDTIDWDLIAKGTHKITANKPRNSCPVCDKRCPQRHNKKDEYLCWNHEHCQIICPPECPNNACNENGTCCDSSCLGTCRGPTNRDCTVCKNVTTVDNECTDKCSNGTLMFMNYRCIDENTCRKMKRPREILDLNVKLYPYKPFEGYCVMECPAGYMDEKRKDGKMWCKKCEGPCEKKCPGSNVDSIAKAQALRGCTHITGSLEIQIRGGKNIVKELEENLNSIQEINGCLKIVRSFPLISLNFLKNLRVIRGNDTNYKYSLTVMDNQNLQELWDWNQHKKIEILSGNGSLGKLFFHFNPKLCYYKIEMLRQKAQLAPFEDIEVAPNSNGDKVACNVTVLRTWITRRSPVSAVVEWEPFIHHDTRSLLGYVVYFIEAPNKNVTLYDGRDACGGDGWKVDDVPATNDGLNEPRKVFSHFLTQLKPYTQYAYYVKTYTIATERSGAQSNLTYFRTNADAPSQPRYLNAWSTSSSEASMTWLPPLHKNGNLTHYQIYGRWDPDDPIFLNQRNYCDEPILLTDRTPISLHGKGRKGEEERKGLEEEEHPVLDLPESCECKNREVDQSQREKEVSSAIAFEDALHNQVYVKRKLLTSKKKRETSTTLILENEPNLSAKDEKRGNDTIVFSRKVPSTNHSFVMKNLRHFATYHMEIQACRAAEPEDGEGEKSKRCSTLNVRTLRTLPKDTADNIPPDSFKMTISGENNSLTMVILQWDEPPDPNGLITTYHIEYRREDIKNYKPTVVCVTRQDFAEAGNSYVLKELPPGNYSVRVRATSLAGNGNYTLKKFFYIKEGYTWSAGWVAAVVVIVIVVVLIVVVILGFVYFIICKPKNLQPLIATVNPEYVSAQYMLDEWEVPREKIELLKSLGTGTFGMVYEGIARDIVKGKSEVRCAVKTVNNDATNRERIAFLNEASVMKGFNTHHVVKLLGVVTRTQPTLVIMELMVNGDLKRYLRSHRPSEKRCNPPKLDRILQMAIEIADGMAYLSTKKFVHRDLAARNCMVAEDLTVKVGDFGMTRDIYETDYYRKGSKGLLPVRWMAPESLKDGVFSASSDVWSYGVVLWEMVTLASQPYLGLSNEEVLRFVMEGNVMNRPENCPYLLYQLMKRTWEFKDTKRPTFLDIVTMLLRHINLKSFQEVSFYHSTEGIEARKSGQQVDQQQEQASLQDLQEEEFEDDEDSPLRPNFDDFASIDPSSIKNSFSSHFRMGSYGENSKATTNCHDMNSSSIPLKASFDGISSDLITSNKDVLSLPFVEDSLKSMKSSPLSNAKSISRSNLSQLSTSNKSVSPKNHSYMNSPNSLKLSNTEYGKGSPEILSAAVKSETVPLRLDFPPMDDIDVDNGIERKKPKSPVDYVNKPETLNNGYIGSTTT